MDPNKKKVTEIKSYNKYSFFNIGTILFGAIFIYMIACVLIYSTTKHIASYEVTTGAISGNYRYTALALKNETKIDSEYTGYVTYYARNGAKAGKDSTICTVDSTGTGHYENNSAELSAEDIQELKSITRTFSLDYTASNFLSTYSLKSDLQSIMLQAKSTSDDISSAGLVNKINAPDSGFIVYEIDGMEGMTENDITEDAFNLNQYSAENLRLNTNVKAGNPLYKIISGEEWTLYFPISAEMMTRLQDRTKIRFRFLKDDTTFSAPFTTIILNGGNYGKITLKNSLVRYVSDRYLEIELLMDGQSGLKVPSSAITERVFYGIPEEYVITNEDSKNEITLLKESFTGNGESVVTYITAQVYAKQDKEYLVDMSLFDEGDYVQLADTSKKRQITANDEVTIQGVYNINQGYAQFRQVTIKDRNEEFCIVSSYTNYGLRAHDFIALNASQVNTDDMVN